MTVSTDSLWVAGIVGGALALGFSYLIRLRERFVNAVAERITGDEISDPQVITAVTRLEINREAYRVEVERNYRISMQDLREMGRRDEELRRRREPMGQNHPYTRGIGWPKGPMPSIQVPYSVSEEGRKIRL